MITALLSALGLVGEKRTSGSGDLAKESGGSGTGNDNCHPARLWEEYKLIQEKIDKIGEFQFRIKSWSATLLGAALFGGVQTSQLPVALSCATVVVIVFHLAERRQRALSKIFGIRAFVIERAFEEFPPIADAARWARVQKAVPSMRSAPGIALRISQEAKRWRNVKKFSGEWFVIHSDDLFYWAQYALVALVLLGYGCFAAKDAIRGKSEREPTYEVVMGDYKIKVYKQGD